MTGAEVREQYAALLPVVIPRAELRVCGPCWDDLCEACTGAPCLCACRDSGPVPAAEARIRAEARAIVEARAEGRRRLEIAAAEYYGRAS